ncbi:LysR family transcriptional regulator [Taklimakanibacter deserti]|uniref:LysR family transcriptional regulator n=1 Tax=Taklimakanibacter deserti TaxID=2267839 RepID=UPI000E651B0B
MELLELRYFVTVAEAGSFSRATVELGTTQPALSRQVRKLESELKCDLFYRHGRGVSLTAAGKKLFDTVKPLLQQVVQIKDEIMEESDHPSGAVAFGVPPSIGATLAAPLSRRFSRECPAVRLRIREAFSSSLSEWVEMGRLDLAILYDARRGRNLNAEPLLREPLFMVEASDRRRGSDGPIELAELSRRRLILPGPENGLRRVIDTAMANADLPLSVTLEIDSVAAIKQLLEMGDDATVLPYGAVHREVREGRLRARRINADDAQAMLVTATPLHRPVTRATRVLLDLVRSEIRKSIKAGVLVGAITGLERMPVAAPMQATEVHGSLSMPRRHS